MKEAADEFMLEFEDSSFLHISRRIAVSCKIAIASSLHE